MAFLIVRAGICRRMYLSAYGGFRELHGSVSVTNLAQLGQRRPAALALQVCPVFASSFLFETPAFFRVAAPAAALL